ncbi:MAG: hypothetical protein IPK28_10590 [Devosia sp.]|nr:hypothetical protein [Devosia sp.]
MTTSSRPGATKTSISGRSRSVRPAASNGSTRPARPGRGRCSATGSRTILDFRGVEFVGDIRIDAGYGEDTIYGNDQDNLTSSRRRQRLRRRRQGSDTYQVTGNQAGGWSSFQDYDTYADSGLEGTDTIAAIGETSMPVKSTAPESRHRRGRRHRRHRSGPHAGRLAGQCARLPRHQLHRRQRRDRWRLWRRTRWSARRATTTMVGAGGNDTSGRLGRQRQLRGHWQRVRRLVELRASYDTYADTGTTGTDTIVALGEQVDIGLRSFDPKPHRGHHATGATGPCGG